MATAFDPVWRCLLPQASDWRNNLVRDDGKIRGIIGPNSDLMDLHHTKVRGLMAPAKAVNEF